MLKASIMIKMIFLICTSIIICVHMERKVNRILGYGLVVELCISENLIKPVRNLTKVGSSLYSVAVYNIN